MLTMFLSCKVYIRLDLLLLGTKASTQFSTEQLSQPVCEAKHKMQLVLRYEIETYLQKWNSASEQVVEGLLLRVPFQEVMQ